MRKRLDYLVLDWYLFWESVLWTATDLVRAARMKRTARMHERYKPPASEPDQSEGEIKN